MKQNGILFAAFVLSGTAMLNSAWAGYYTNNKSLEEPNNREIRIAVGTLAYREDKLRIEERRLLRWENRLKRFNRELENLEDRNDEISRRQGQIIVESIDAGDENRQAQLRLSREKVDLRVEYINNRRRIAALKLLIANAKQKIKYHKFWVNFWTLDVRAAKKRLIEADRR